MKKITSIFVLLFFVGCSSSDKIINLENRINKLQEQVNKLSEQITSEQSSINDLDKRISEINPNQIENKDSINNSKKISPDSKPGQCKAITKAGTQCKRNAMLGSDYCWQHQGYNQSNMKNNSPSSNYETDKTIHTGPRGGQYYINSKGKKVYIKKKK